MKDLTRLWLPHFIIAGMIAVSAPAVGQIVPGGEYNCEDWKSQNVKVRGWLIGFLAGFNLARMTETKGLYDPLTDRLRGVTSERQLLSWVDGYCQASPSNNLAKGAMMFLYTQNAPSQ